jgi:hypothetical protein
VVCMHAWTWQRFLQHLQEMAGGHTCTAACAPAQQGVDTAQVLHMWASQVSQTCLHQCCHVDQATTCRHSSCTIPFGPNSYCQ